MEIVSKARVRQLGPAGQLMARIIEYRLSVASPEEKLRYDQSVSSGQLGSTLGAVCGLGKAHYREDMKQAFVDPDHANHSLAVNLAKSGVADDGREVFGWISS